MKRTALLALSLLALGTAAFATVAFAHGGATGIVKERMDQMSAVSKSMKAIAAMMRGKEPYDPDRVRSLAAEVGARGGTHLTELFPEGSLDHPTEALATVWTDWARFAEEAEEMRRAATALAKGAASDNALSLFSDLAGTCKSCHDRFRVMSFDMQAPTPTEVATRKAQDWITQRAI